MGLSLYACNPSNHTETNSAEVSKVFLTTVFFPGDEVLAEQQISGWVLQSDSVQVRMLLPGGQIISRRTEEVRKFKAGRIFRGAEPGIPLNWVRKCEPSQPVYQDSLGLSYLYSLGPGKNFRVDYYVFPGRTPQRVQSIFMESSFELESDAIRFYREISNYLERNFDVPQGQLGDFTFIVPEKSLVLQLSLSGQKKVVTLSIDYLSASKTES
jgi:hypothetical protein